MAIHNDKEIQEYRDLMKPPGEYEDGFTWRSVLGLLFACFVMMPGAIYMRLVAGHGIGPAATWVTVILFIEVAKRARSTLGKADIFILFYIAGGTFLAPFDHLLFFQFLAQSEPAKAMGIVEGLPQWVAPTDPEVLAQRTFLHKAWLPALLIWLFKIVVGRLDDLILGYGLFRITSDYEQLPFPMAPLGALGLTALAESSSGEESWRWRVFSIGAAIGMAFGTLYMGIPTITGALLQEPVHLIPIPWADFTDKTENILPAVATGMSFDLGQFFLGMVVPFFAVMGMLAGVVITFIANPILQKFEILHSWEKGSMTVETLFLNRMDFYLSFSIGISIAIAVVGIYYLFKLKADDVKSDKGVTGFDPSVLKKRGDIPFWVIILFYFLCTIAYIVMAEYLVGWDFPIWILIFFGFVYTPFVSYVTARLEGMAGKALQIPMVKEVAFILSGYVGVDIWFVPLPMQNYGYATVLYRKCELMGTKFKSIWKAEMLIIPCVFISSVIFMEFLWRLAPIPSSIYPFTQKMWELRAMNQCLIYSSTVGGYSPFYEALNFWYLGAGAVLGLVSFVTFTMMGLPVLFVYGAVQGLNQTMPHIFVPRLLGALVGRYYFYRKMGKQWRYYAPVLSAGFACGMGLVSMFFVGVIFLSKSIFQLPF